MRTSNDQFQQKQEVGCDLVRREVGGGRDERVGIVKKKTVEELRNGVGGGGTASNGRRRTS